MPRHCVLGMIGNTAEPETNAGATMFNVNEIIKANGITMTCETRSNNPNMIDGHDHMTHWSCKIKAGGKQLTVPFSMGPALVGEPKLPEVLDCLASDASGVENARSFEDWCSEYGYDTDSRKAERTFKICMKQRDQLKQLLGAETFEKLLWETERQ